MTIRMIELYSVPFVKLSGSSIATNMIHLFVNTIICGGVAAIRLQTKWLASQWKVLRVPCWFYWSIPRQDISMLILVIMIGWALIDWSIHRLFHAPPNLSLQDGTPLPMYSTLITQGALGFPTWRILRVTWLMREPLPMSCGTWSAPSMVCTQSTPVWTCTSLERAMVSGLNNILRYTGIYWRQGNCVCINMYTCTCTHSHAHM